MDLAFSWSSFIEHWIFETLPNDIWTIHCCIKCPQILQVKTLLQTNHSDLKRSITFGNWFWHLTVENRPIVLNFYQQKPVFSLKNCPRPKRPKKTNEGQQRPAKSKTLNFFVIITIQCKIINKCEYDSKRICF